MYSRSAGQHAASLAVAVQPAGLQPLPLQMQMNIQEYTQSNMVLGLPTTSTYRPKPVNVCASTCTEEAPIESSSTISPLSVTQGLAQMYPCTSSVYLDQGNAIVVTVVTSRALVVGTDEASLASVPDYNSSSGYRMKQVNEQSQLNYVDYDHTYNA